MRRHMIRAGALLYLFVGSGLAFPDSVAFTFTPINVPGASVTMATGINNSGEVVGLFIGASGTAHSFLDIRDNFTVVDVPGAFFTNISGINDKGEIVGLFGDPNGITHGFLGREASFTDVTCQAVSSPIRRGSTTEARSWGRSSARTPHSRVSSLSKVASRLLTFPVV